MLKHLRYALEAAFFYPLYGGLRLLPIRALSALGASLGAFLKKIRREDAVALANIARALPNVTPEARRAIVDRVWENSGRVFFEFLAIDRLLVDRHVRVSGETHIQKSLAEGRPIIFISGHLGNWNVSMRVIRDCVGDVAGIYRKANNPLIEPAVNKLYRSISPQMLTSSDDVRTMLRLLRSGTALAILSDQHNSSGVEVTFFGQKVLAPSGAAFLAWRSGAALIPLTCHRVLDGPDHVTFNVAFEEPIDLPPPDMPRDQAITLLTQSYYTRLEKFIISHPEAWFWLHARFTKYTPPAEMPAQD